MLQKDKINHSTEAEGDNPRRTALKQMALMFGLSLSAQSLDALATTVKATMPHTTKFLSPDQLQMVGLMADLIIPTTDTPGALAVNVHGFMDAYLAECVNKDDQKNFLAGLDRINKVAKEKYGKVFLVLNQKQQIELLTAIEKPDVGFTKDDKDFFKKFKSHTLFGYYTSEVGATQELAYLAVPGGYKGNVPFAKLGKTWALN